MKVVYIKKTNYKNYKLNNINGYSFKPKNKHIKNLIIVNTNLLKKILTIKLKKDIKNVDHIINLMIQSNVTDINDCNLMLNEINRVTKNLENNYKIYFTEFEYFNYLKEIYKLNMEITTKKKLIEMN